MTVKVKSQSNHENAWFKALFIIHKSAHKYFLNCKYCRNGLQKHQTLIFDLDYFFHSEFLMSYISQNSPIRLVPGFVWAGHNLFVILLLRVLPFAFAGASTYSENVVLYLYGPMSVSKQICKQQCEIAWWILHLGSILQAGECSGYCLISGNLYTFSLYKGIVKFIFQAFCLTCILNYTQFSTLADIVLSKCSFRDTSKSYT